MLLGLLQLLLHLFLELLLRLLLMVVVVVVVLLCRVDLPAKQPSWWCCLVTRHRAELG